MTPIMTPTTEITVITEIKACFRLALRYRMARKASNRISYEFTLSGSFETPKRLFISGTAGPVQAPRPFPGREKEPGLISLSYEGRI
jgi:hypothetical protein